MHYIQIKILNNLTDDPVFVRGYTDVTEQITPNEGSIVNSNGRFQRDDRIIFNAATTYPIRDDIVAIHPEQIILHNEKLIKAGVVVESRSVDQQFRYQDFFRITDQYAIIRPMVNLSIIAKPFTPVRIWKSGKPRWFVGYENIWMVIDTHGIHPGPDYILVQPYTDFYPENKHGNTVFSGKTNSDIMLYIHPETRVITSHGEMELVHRINVIGYAK